MKGWQFVRTYSSCKVNYNITLYGERESEQLMDGRVLRGTIATWMIVVPFVLDAGREITKISFISISVLRECRRYEEEDEFAEVVSVGHVFLVCTERHEYRFYWVRRVTSLVYHVIGYFLFVSRGAFSSYSIFFASSLSSGDLTSLSLSPSLFQVICDVIKWHLFLFPSHLAFCRSLSLSLSLCTVNNHSFRAIKHPNCSINALLSPFFSLLSRACVREWEKTLPTAQADSTLTKKRAVTASSLSLSLSHA